MSEPTAADRWVYTKLTADATLTPLIGTRVFGEIAPQGTAMPYIVFQMQSAVDLRIVGPYTVWSNMLYVVRGIAETNSFGGNLGTIDNRITAVLHNTSGSNVDGLIYVCVRVQPFRLTEIVDGRSIRHAGGIFRILAKAA